MGSIYNIEDRIERIERYLGIDDSKRIQEKNDYNDIRNESDQMDDHLFRLEKSAKEIITDIEKATKSLEKYKELLYLIKKK